MIYDLQRASMWKRIPAYIFDCILIATLAVGLALALSAILGYNGYNARLDAAYDSYAAEYGVDFDISSSDFEKLSETEQARYDEAMRALFSDDEVRFVYTMIVNLTLLITSISILLSFVILEFILPLLFGNGQTLGKKAFGIAVMRLDGVKIGTPILFVRSILGKYTLETMVPVLFLLMLYFGMTGGIALLLIGALLVGQLILIFTTRAHTPLHDVIASTVTVDMASQMIFDSQEAMLAYKKSLHAEHVSQNKD